MGRLKLLKFTNLDELFEYYSDNGEYLHTETLLKLEEVWNKYRIFKTVDIFKINCTDVSDINYISIMEDEWEFALKEMKNFFVSIENYELAARVRKLEKEILNLEEED